jgi:hypothetical protein
MDIQCERSDPLAVCLDVNDTDRYVRAHHQVMTFVLFTRRIRIHCQLWWVSGGIVRHVVYVHYVQGKLV